MRLGRQIMNCDENTFGKHESSNVSFEKERKDFSVISWKMYH